MEKSVRDFKTKVMSTMEIKAPKNMYIVVTLIDSEAYMIEKPLSTLDEAEKLLISYPGHHVNIFDDAGLPVFK